MCLHIRVLSRQLTYPTWEMERHFQKCLKKRMYVTLVPKRVCITCLCPNILRVYVYVCVFSIICTKINCFNILNIIPHSFRKIKGLTSNSKKVPRFSLGRKLNVYEYQGPEVSWFLGRAVLEIQDVEIKGSQLKLWYGSHGRPSVGHPSSNQMFSCLVLLPEKM